VSSKYNGTSILNAADLNVGVASSLSAGVSHELSAMTSNLNELGGFSVEICITNQSRTYFYDVTTSSLDGSGFQGTFIMSQDNNYE
jgi:hypothetical protein